ncbi:hypothetical protein [Salinisphaera sp. Q1T1-3]|uniref:hypothetical protein n=1 Tax=Salinisphaera sp. Q1T1-3 TaxID=2321229 RepID=UPI000E73F934|nr:hypothetical protein [Salinisphaera sp. Q1T1-3]RJS95285.1 hypothetical protein D3260_01665 [Salinisphaera sp. Q1T1-3]
MTGKAIRRRLPRLSKLPRNPTHAPRNDGYRWNISTIADALNLSRDTVRRRLREAGIEPDGYVSNSPVYALAKAIPPLFGHAPRKPKEQSDE